MDQLINGSVEIEGFTWYTRESFMLHFDMKKSNFYNLVKSKSILSHKLFSHPNTLFYVYRMEGDL